MITVDAIRAGLTQGEFFLEYLPTVSLAEGRCVGAEALTRADAIKSLLFAQCQSLGFNITNEGKGLPA